MTDQFPEIEPTADAAVLARLYDEVLAPSFPPTELVPRKAFLRDGTAGALDVLVARRDDLLAGAIVGARHGAAVLMVWLAVGSAGRGGGTGSALFAAGVERWLAQPGVLLVLGEIERPDTVPAHAEYGDPERRVAFYAHQGVGALDMPYYQPPVAPDMPRVRGLMLCVFAAAAGVHAPRTLGDDEVSAVRGFLTETMGEPADAETAAVHAAVTPGLRIVPLG